MAGARHVRSRGAECRGVDRTRPRRRGGGTCGAGRHQFRRGGGRLGPLAGGARRLERICRRLFGDEPRRQRLGHRRRGHRHGARLRLFERGLRRRSARPRGNRQECGRARNQAPRRQKDADLPLPGRVRPAGRARSDLGPAGGDFGAFDRPRHQLSEGSARRADLPRGDHDHRRSAPAARAALKAVRRRGAPQLPPRHHRQGRLDDLAVGPALGASIESQDRPGMPRAAPRRRRGRPRPMCGSSPVR